MTEHKPLAEWTEEEKREAVERSWNTPYWEAHNWDCSCGVETALDCQCPVQA